MHSARKQQDHPSEVRVLPLARDFSIVAKLVGSARSRVGLTIEAAELSAISCVGGDVAALYPKTKRLGRV
jgi:hypothetical protein